MVTVARSLVLGLFVAGTASVTLAADPPTVSLSPPSLTVKLAPRNNSGESGIASLVKAGDHETKVVMTVKGAPAGVSQPAHIHKGTCDELDAKPAFPLSPVVGGKSETTVKASLEDLRKGGYVINGHKSAQEASTYVFCGTIGGS